MMLDELDKEQLGKLIKFIGTGKKPYRQARFLIKNGGLYEEFKPTKGLSRTMCDVRTYAHTKLAALLTGSLPETRKIYTNITAQIWVGLPNWARVANYDCIINKEK